MVGNGEKGRINASVMPSEPRLHVEARSIEGRNVPSSTFHRSAPNTLFHTPGTRGLYHFRHVKIRENKKNMLETDLEAKSLLRIIESFDWPVSKRVIDNSGNYPFLRS